MEFSKWYKYNKHPKFLVDLSLRACLLWSTAHWVDNFLNILVSTRSPLPLRPTLTQHPTANSRSLCSHVLANTSVLFPSVFCQELFNFICNIHKRKGLGLASETSRLGCREQFKEHGLPRVARDARSSEALNTDVEGGEGGTQGGKLPTVDEETKGISGWGRVRGRMVKEMCRNKGIWMRDTASCKGQRQHWQKDQCSCNVWKLISGQKTEWIRGCKHPGCFVLRRVKWKYIHALALAFVHAHISKHVN